MLYLQITFAVNLTLSGGSGLLPFTTQQQQKLLTPINAFLGDHGNASVNSTHETSGSVRAQQILLAAMYQGDWQAWGVVKSMEYAASRHGNACALHCERYEA